MPQLNVQGCFVLEALGTMFTSFSERVRNIHLNPLRARLVASLTQLDRYPWCGLAVVLGRQDLDYVLRWFEKKGSLAKKV